MRRADSPRRTRLLLAGTLLGVAGCRSEAPAPPAPPDGAALFQMACSRCHGPEGRGDGPLALKFGPVPDLLEASLPARYPRLQLEEMLRYGRGKMPPHRDRMSPAELSAVAGYVEQRFFGRR